MNVERLIDAGGSFQAHSLRKSYFELGKSLMQQGDWKKAQENLFHSLQSNDGSVEDWKIYGLLSQINQQDEKPGMARSFMFQAIATAPPDIAEQLTQELSLNTEIFEEQETDSHILNETLLLHGEAEWLRKQKKFTDAREKIEKSIHLAQQKSLSEQEISGRLSLARIEYEAGIFLQAQQQLSRIDDSADPQVRTIAKLLNAKCRLAQKDYEAALKTAQELISESNSLEAHILKLQSFIYNSGYDEALEAVHNAFISYPSHDDLFFYKMEILLEGNFNPDEAFGIFEDLKSRNGIDFLVEKLDAPYLRFRHHHGNDNLFLAQLYLWLPENFPPTAVLEQADKAIEEGVNFKNTKYPNGIVYRLKALAYEKTGDIQSAADAYLSAGKEFYWNWKYEMAKEFFKEAKKLNPELVENYRYYADNQLMLSFTMDYPYVNGEYVKEAFDIWQQGYSKQLPSQWDAWTYLTLARIYGQQALLPDFDKGSSYRSAWLAVEKNRVVMGDSFYGWTYLSRVFREMESMDISAYNAGKKAVELNDNSSAWEELAATSLNLRYWDEGLNMLQKLLSGSPDNVVYKGWEGFAWYGKKEYQKAAVFFSEVLEKDPSWVWARHFRILCNWFLNKGEELKPDVSHILSKEKHYIENKSYWEVAFAYLLNGDYEKAEEISEIGAQQRGSKEVSYYDQCVIHAMAGDKQRVRSCLDKYLKTVRNVHDLEALNLVLNQTFKNRGESNDFQKEITEKIGEILQKPITSLTELQALEAKEEEYRDEKRDAWLAIHLAYSRVYLENKDWMMALKQCEEVNAKRKDYPDAKLMYDIFVLELQSWLADFIESERQFNQWLLINDTLSAVPPYFISLPDTWYIASLLARTGGNEAQATEWYNKADSLYSSLNTRDMHINISRLKKSYPFITALLGKEDADIFLTETKCRNCGAKITSPKQRFCYNCGANLSK